MPRGCSFELKLKMPLKIKVHRPEDERGFSLGPTSEELGRSAVAVEVSISHYCRGPCHRFMTSLKPRRQLCKIHG